MDHNSHAMDHNSHATDHNSHATDHNSHAMDKNSHTTDHNSHAMDHNSHAIPRPQVRLRYKDKVMKMNRWFHSADPHGKFHNAFVDRYTHTKH
jgi:hypothetical protein